VSGWHSPHADTGKRARRDEVRPALIDLGSSLPMFGADGSFGGETGDAVTAFKTGQEIFPNDPVVGRQTMARLDAIFAP